MSIDRLSTLPEESLSEILWRTSPAEASRFAVISKASKSAADSDTVWEKFLPSDLPEIVSRSVSPVTYATRKELYFSLCRSPILIDAGKLSFSLEKKSGKKCFMVGARELGIIWCGDTPWYWDFTSHPDSRFSDVALLKSVFWLEIRSTISTRMLSPNTIYGAYLVFKLEQRCYGLESTNAFVRFVNDKVEGDDEREAILDHFEQENGRDRDRETGEAPVRIGDGLTEIALVHLQRANASQQQQGKHSVMRSDGWMEVEMGSFYCDGGDDGAVETWLMGREGYQGKSGLIVHGIEFRPKEIILIDSQANAFEQIFPMTMDRLSALPDESLSEILWRTSPAEASRFAVISKASKSVADSDVVWDKFLPSDLPEIVSRSVSPVTYATKKELYLSLCRSPILIDAGKLSFSLEKKSGKKCYMVGARDLGIVWCGDTPWHWDFTSHPDSRFSDVALLKSVFWLEIRSTISTRMLSPNTIYGAYLVFKLKKRCYGLVSANALVRFVDDKVDGDDEREAILHHFGQPENGTGEAPVRIGDGLTEIALVHLQQLQQEGKLSVMRNDGWMEVEMGSFFCDRGDDGAVETWLLGRKAQEKSGLIVHGIEFRPK